MLDQAAYYLCENVSGGGQTENQDLVLEEFGFSGSECPLEAQVFVEIRMHVDVIIRRNEVKNREKVALFS